jgi:hypothetical protein
MYNGNVTWGSLTFGVSEEKADDYEVSVTEHIFILSDSE